MRPQSKMWCTFSPGITSRHRNEEALCSRSDSNTTIIEHFYGKPIKSEVLTYKRAPFFKSHAQCQAERRYKTRERPLCVCVCPCSLRREFLLSTQRCRLIAFLFSTIESPGTGLNFQQRRPTGICSFVQIPLSDLRKTVVVKGTSWGGQNGRAWPPPLDPTCSSQCL